MTADAARPRLMLGISDEPGVPLAADLFIGAFVALGSALRRTLPSLDGRQLVVALSVPRRDYAAALVGAGWQLSAPPPDLGEPIDVFRKANRQTYLRAVTKNKVVAGVFSGLDESCTPPRVVMGGKHRTVDWYQAVAELCEPCDNIETDLPGGGFLATLTGAAPTWLARMASPARDLAVVGTSKWLRADLAALVGNGTEAGAEGTPLAHYVLPPGDRVATWATPILPSARLGEGDPLPAHCLAAILDGYGAIKYLNEVSTPIVVCIIDRSIADESAAELVVQARVANSRPMSLRDELRWRPPHGVEALAFKVAL